MSNSFTQYKESLGALFSEGKYDDLLSLIQGGLTNEDLLNESLLWIGLMASKTENPKYALAPLMSLALRDSGPIPVKLLTILLAHPVLAAAAKLNGDETSLAIAQKACAAEWYRTTPTEFEAFQSYLAALLISELDSDQQLAKKMLHWHLPELTQIQSILTMIRLLPEGYLPELGAVTQQGGKLIGWVAVKSAQAAPQLVVATGGKQMLLTPNVMLYQDEQWSIFKLEVVFSQQDMDYQTVQVGIVREGTQQVKVLVGCPLIWMPTKRPEYTGLSSHQSSPKVILGQTVSKKSKSLKLAEPKKSRVNTLRDNRLEDKIGLPVDVMIPVYANKTMTLACVESVLACVSVNKTPQRILVINDASPDLELVQALQALAQEDQITLLHHEHNMGFIGSINHGLSQSATDVVLLNSDTLVHGNWLDRLQQVAYSEEKVASVTPFTNNGELMSLLAPCDPAEALTPEQLAQLDRSAATANAKNKSVRLDTGCGFCFYMTRDALLDVGGLDPTLRRGYGEESDWSYRAASKGWIHLGAMNTVVAHQGGISFGAEKRFRVMQNLSIIEKRYPDSTRNFKTCLRRDPMKPGRNRLRRVWLHAQALNRINPSQQGELRISHSLALAERFLADMGSKGSPGHTLMLARINSNKVTLSGTAPHAWRIQYTLPDQVNLLQQDLQKLGVFTLYADTQSLKRWWQGAVPSLPVAVTPYSILLNASDKADAPNVELLIDGVQPPANSAQQHLNRDRLIRRQQTGQTNKSALVLAVVGQEEAFASTEFLQFANQLVAQKVPVYLLPTRYPTVNANAIFATAKVFPTPFSLNRYDERVDFYRQCFPLDGVLLLDTLPATIQEAGLLDNEKRDLPWLIGQDCSLEGDSINHSLLIKERETKRDRVSKSEAVGIENAETRLDTTLDSTLESFLENRHPMNEAIMTLQHIKGDALYWVTSLQQLAKGWANAKANDQPHNHANTVDN